MRAVGNGVARGHMRSLRPRAGISPCGRKSSTSSDCEEQERLAEHAEVGRKQCLQQDRGGADQETAKRRAGQAAQPADDGADKGDDDELQAHARLHQPGLRDEQAGDRRREQAADARRRWRSRGWRVRRAARAMRKFSAAARISRPSRVDFRNQVVATRSTTLTRMVTSWRTLQPDAGDLDLACQHRQEVDALRPRADQHDHRLLQEEADREGGDEQVAGSASRSGRKADAFGEQREQHRRRRARPTTASAADRANKQRARHSRRS